MKKRQLDTFDIGQTLYFQNDYTGTFLSGEVIKITPQYCIVQNENSGYTKRKAKHLLFSSLDAAKLSVIKKIDAVVQEQFLLNINELYKIYSEMLDKFPEKFV